MYCVFCPTTSIKIAFLGDDFTDSVDGGKIIQLKCSKGRILNLNLCSNVAQLTPQINTNRTRLRILRSHLKQHNDSE